MLSTIAFVSQAYEGASASLWFAGTQVAGTVTVFLLSIPRGHGPFVSRPDERVLWLAAIGLVIWYFTETAVYALALTITVSLLGGVLTVRQAYLTPHRETMAKWVISLFAACFSIAAIGAFEPVLLAYPAYIMMLDLMIIGAMLSGRRMRRLDRFSHRALPH